MAILPAWMGGAGADPQSKPSQDMSGRPRIPGSIPTQPKSRLRKQISRNLAQYLYLFAFILVIVGCFFFNWNTVYLQYCLSFRCACLLSLFICVPLSATPWSVACQAPLSMGFSGQEYWSESPCPPPGHLSDSGIKKIVYGEWCWIRDIQR